MKSIWQQSVKVKRFERLTQNKTTDILIIGGGLAGILCGYKLAQSGADCIIIEANRICDKTTANTTGKITAQHGLIYTDIFEKYGVDAAKDYLEANLSALKDYRNICQNIDCDFEIKDNYVYSTDRKKLEREIEVLKEIGYNAKLKTNLPIKTANSGAVCFEKQAQFNPLKFVSSICNDLEIYERTIARKIEKNIVYTDTCKIYASKIIVATHFPIINKHGGYFLKMYQHRSYLLALENAPDIEGMYVGCKKTDMTFRNYNGMLLVGGGGHRTGKHGGGYDELMQFVRTHYPEAKIKTRFAAQDCITLDGIAYIGEYSKLTPNLFVATGFNKWGMSLSMVSASLLCDLVQNRKNKYSKLFSPSRSLMHPQLLTNAFESVYGILTPTKPRCTHMGCALKWNLYEHSWDCSCHGSRFDENGEILNSPANKKGKF